MYPDFTWPSLLEFTQKHYKADTRTLDAFSSVKKMISHKVKEGCFWWVNCEEKHNRNTKHKRPALQLGVVVLLVLGESYLCKWKDLSDHDDIRRNKELFV
ncbi:hypothetical protein VNO77_02594 [Canavalia gladiata]|uniref:Uncharacterized protein n=1 Tax=Canavalia gladiata TaxID=3824 RepID=A0AAN9R625_CANGL